jgi:Zn-dependent M28 family amino/carboxypeptidase
MKKPLALLALFCASLSFAAQKQSTEQRVMTEALKPSQLQENLRVLTDEIGGRVPGTPAMEKAVRWGVDAFKAAGADNVQVESYSIPHSWQEGATRVAITSPAQFNLRAVSVGWAPATSGPVKARVADVGKGDPAGFSKAGDISGSLLLVHTETMKTWDDLFAEYRKAPAIIDAAMKGKAAGIAFISTRERDLLYRHINTNHGEIDRLPIVIIAREDGERVARLVAKGFPVEAEFDLPNKIGGAFDAANVVAEIKGKEKPEEYVLLGAHLDSWDLGTGALDNGCNAALVIDALRAIKTSGLQPRRSIRFVLFTGEEQGTLGSRAYVAAHRSEMDKIAGVLVFDEGTGKATGFSVGGRKDLLGPVSNLVSAFKNWGATKLTTDAFVGTDNLDFLLEGVPNLVANQVEANYLENYHASSDTYDKVDFAQLKKHVAIASALMYEIADAPQPLGPRQDRTQVEALVKETHLDDQLKAFGMWQEWKQGTRGRAKR